MVVRLKHVADNLNKIVSNEFRSNATLFPNLFTTLFKITSLKMVVRLKHVADNLNKKVNNGFPSNTTLFQ
jgi:hypothetical protein